MAGLSPCCEMQHGACGCMRVFATSEPQVFSGDEAGGGPNRLDGASRTTRALEASGLSSSRYSAHHIALSHETDEQHGSGYQHRGRHLIRPVAAKGDMELRQ